MNLKTGNLVWVSPGNYLTEIRKNLLDPAQILLPNPALGVVVGEVQNRKVVLLEGDEYNCIFVRDTALSEL